MRIPVALRVLGAASLAVFTACSELPSAPAAAPLDLAAPSLAKGGNTGSQSKTVTIDIDTRTSKFYSIGSQSWVYIPAGALCSDDSGYGPELWDAPCTPATGTVSMDVTVVAQNGRPAAEFHKDVRFAPTASSDWRDWVILGLKMQGNLNRQLGYGILYRPTGSNRLIDESATDPSLRAFRAPGNVIARRVKHFSGYNVSLGFSEQTDPMDGFGGLQ